MESGSTGVIGLFAALEMALLPFILFVLGVVILIAPIFIWIWIRRTAREVGKVRLQLAEANKTLRLIAARLSPGQAEAARELSLLQEETDPDVVQLTPAMMVKK